MYCTLASSIAYFLHDHEEFVSTSVTKPIFLIKFIKFETPCQIQIVKSCEKQSKLRDDLQPLCKVVDTY